MNIERTVKALADYMSDVVYAPNVYFISNINIYVFYFSSTSYWSRSLNFLINLTVYFYNTCFNQYSKMFYKLLFAVFVLYAAGWSTPWFQHNTPTTIDALGNLASAFKNDTVRLIYEHTAFLQIRHYIQEMDRKLLEYNNLLGIRERNPGCIWFMIGRPIWLGQPFDIYNF